MPRFLLRRPGRIVYGPPGRREGPGAPGHARGRTAPDARRHRPLRYAVASATRRHGTNPTGRRERDLRASHLHPAGRHRPDRGEERGRGRPRDPRRRLREAGGLLADRDRPAQPGHAPLELRRPERTPSPPGRAGEERAVGKGVHPPHPRAPRPAGHPPPRPRPAPQGAGGRRQHLRIPQLPHRPGAGARVGEALPGNHARARGVLEERRRVGDRGGAAERGLPPLGLSVRGCPHRTSGAGRRGPALEGVPGQGGAAPRGDALDDPAAGQRTRP